MSELGNPKLIIFDLDGTLRDYDSRELLPGVGSWFDENAGKFKLAIATNQGGVGLRQWMERDGFGDPHSYPDEASIQKEISDVMDELDRPGAELPKLYICYAYQSKKSGKWSPVPDGHEGDFRYFPEWRKPAPGMLGQAMIDAGIRAEDTLMVGDSDEDFKAAMSAGCYFQWAYEFFGWEPEPSGISGV